MVIQNYDGIAIHVGGSQGMLSHRYSALHCGAFPKQSFTKEGVITDNLATLPKFKMVHLKNGTLEEEQV